MLNYQSVKEAAATTEDTIQASLITRDTSNSARELNEALFSEIVRRIPKPQLILIEDKLRLVTPTHLNSLIIEITSPDKLLKIGSIIHDEMFPFIALEAVRTGQISSLQFGTLMALWGNLETILPKPADNESQVMPEFVPLFTIDGEKNPRASTLLLLCLKPSPTIPNLVTKTPEELLKGIYDKATHLPQSEQCFWVIKKNSDYSLAKQTVTDRIKSLDVKFLAFGTYDKQEMIPSFGLQQAFLDVAFPHAVRINPVIGPSSPLDIRKGSLERYRDIALPFPGNELPKIADDFPAPTAFDFIYHDRYHAIRASRVTPLETAHYVAIGDKLNIMQERYDLLVKQFSKRHKEHIRLLPEFAKAIKKLPADKRREVTEQILIQFNREIAIINKLKKMRKSNGQLKFRIWDMERVLSGGPTDGPVQMAYEELSRIMGNIEFDIAILGKLPNTVALSRYSGRRAAQAVLEVVKPNPVVLKQAQTQLQLSKDLLRLFSFSFFAEPPGQKAFTDALVEAKPSMEDEAIHHTALEFIKQLNILKNKAQQLSNKRHYEAAAAVNNIHSSLYKAYLTYQNSGMHEADKITLCNACKNVLDNNKKDRFIIEQHRGWKQILGNLALAIAGLGIGYVVAGLINKSHTGHFLFFRTHTAHLVDEMENLINKTHSENR